MKRNHYNHLTCSTTSTDLTIQSHVHQRSPASLALTDRFVVKLNTPISQGLAIDLGYGTGYAVILLDFLRKE
ncbi:hypothetical protein [Phormidium sp. FACHB-592]|uniref:hypothetical protein n=1 Tax=Phormidium sp. FACHB-592 TaxID=2692850 RepID=UPI001A7EA606|nr:hypothetical protein [Phormidium sp. FACHB-592]